MDKVFFAQKSVIYNKESKKVLVLQRSDYKPESALKWDLVGCSVDSGENAEEALIREGLEELNVELNNRHIIDFYSRPADNKSDYTFIFGLCLCDDYNFLENGKPKLSKEHVAYKWVDLNEIEELEFLPSINRIKHKIKPFLERFY